MTAVEWLRSKMLFECLEPSDDMFEQALEMEKQQIIDAHGDKLKISSGTTSFEYWLTGEDYYKKQFNK
jgi:hypothetical protein